MQREKSEFNASGDIAKTSGDWEAYCFAKSAARRHIILKEGLTRRTGTVGTGMAGGLREAQNHAGIRPRVAYSCGDSAPASGPASRCFIHDILLNCPEFRTRFARAFTPPSRSDGGGMRDCGGRACAGRLSAVADMGTASFERAGAVARQHRS